MAFFHRFRVRRLWRPRLNLRNHRKIVVIDGSIGFTGGINISDTENEALRTDAFHDLHLRMDGEAVRWLQLAFAEDWAYASGRAPGGAVAVADTGGRAPSAPRYLPAGPDSPWEPIHRVMLAAMYRAERRIWLATPYFVPGEAARMALTSAALRGLDVRLLVPARDRLPAGLGGGALVFRRTDRAPACACSSIPRMLHAKALLVDSETCLLGSSNFDNRSFRLNFELCVLFEDAGWPAS